MGGDWVVGGGEGKVDDDEVDDQVDDEVDDEGGGEDGCKYTIL